MRKVLAALGWAVKGLLVLLLAVLLAYNAWMLIARYALGQERPTAFGYAFSVVVSGSMEPALSVNDLIVTHAEEEYAVGDVIMFYDASRGEYVTHRIVLASGAGYATKGDANNAQDAFTVPPSAVVGKVVYSLGGVGSAVRFLQSPGGFFAVLAAGVVLWLAIDISSGRKRNGKNEREQQQN